MTTLGEKIRELRGQGSIVSFCKEFNIHKNTLSNYEANKTTPNAEFITALCNNYKVNANWLFFGEGPKNKAGSLKIPTAQLDKDLFSDTFVALEKSLQVTKRVLPPTAKADLITKTYELFCEDEQKPNEEKLLKLFNLLFNFPGSFRDVN